MDYLEHGRACYARRSWGDAYRALTSADQIAPLEVDDLDRLATAAYLTSREEKFLGLHERLFRAHVAAGSTARAARCAFWLAITYLLCGEAGRSNAWLARGWPLSSCTQDALRRRTRPPAAPSTSGIHRGTPIWRPRRAICRAGR
jgi:hypothetical protein